MHTAELIVRDLLVFVGALFVLTVVLILVVVRLPPEHPLKAMFTALTWRVGATFGAGLLAIPIEPIPGLDALYDIAVPIGLAIYWITFLRNLMRGPRRTLRAPYAPTRRF
jgi:hypothetical protein